MQATFTGKEYDGENGLQYYGARYLDNNVGKFISVDPATLALGNAKEFKDRYGRTLEMYLANPQSLNSYSYTENNPLNKIDPTGEASLTAWILNPIGTGLQIGGLKLMSGIYSKFNPDTTKYSNELFNRSLSFRPSDISIGEQGQYSGMVTDIKNSDDYSQYINSVIEQANTNGQSEFNYSYFGESSDGSQGNSINFTSGDLHTAIGGTLRTDVSGKKSDDGKWSLNVGIHDQYNFEYKGLRDYNNNWKVTTANNSMLLPQTFGVISNYKIDINFNDIR